VSPMGIDGHSFASVPSGPHWTATGWERRVVAPPGRREVHGLLPPLSTLGRRSSPGSASASPRITRSAEPFARSAVVAETPPCTDRIPLRMIGQRVRWERQGPLGQPDPRATIAPV
jgi:hypothetical protein